MIDLKKYRILVTGGNGFIGQSVIENLISVRGVKKENIVVPKHGVDDLRIYQNCERLLKENSIDIVIHLAAKVGGVGYSIKFPATQLYDNVLMDMQITEASRRVGIKKIVLVSSSCAYPKNSNCPMLEEDLWNGLPQESNLAYGVGKRLLTVSAPAYRSEHKLNAVVVIPNNAYGPGDSFHPEFSHVIPSLIRKCLSGEPAIEVWGDGTPTRDFFYVKDFAEGVVLAAEKLESSEESINLGSGTETRISDLVDIIIRLTKFKGTISYDKQKPNGQPRRSVDISKARNLLGFNPRWSLEEGLINTIEWYKTNKHIL